MIVSLFPVNAIWVNSYAGRAFDMGIFCATTGQLLGGAGINQLSPHHRYGNIGY